MTPLSLIIFISKMRCAQALVCVTAFSAIALASALFAVEWRAPTCTGWCKPPTLIARKRSDCRVHVYAQGRVATAGRKYCGATHTSSLENPNAPCPARKLHTHTHAHTQTQHWSFEPRIALLQSWSLQPKSALHEAFARG